MKGNLSIEDVLLRKQMDYCVPRLNDISLFAKCENSLKSKNLLAFSAYILQVATYGASILPAILFYKDYAPKGANLGIPNILVLLIFAFHIKR